MTFQFHNSIPASCLVPEDDAIVISSDDDSEEDTDVKSDFDHDDSRAGGGKANDEGTEGADTEEIDDSKDGTSNDGVNGAVATDSIADGFADTDDDTSVAGTASDRGREGGPTDAAGTAIEERMKLMVQEMSAIRATLARIEAKLPQNAVPPEVNHTSTAITSLGKRRRTSPASEVPKRQRKARG
ncbi:hypothetical protein CORC01_14463 [Colletotrichum orchidophilum]|uniref:Uncharacterized protein n=1 Tax=Colletotrichum orchidophilum TaxID=1209926 RepID=A0A1G4AMI8_9PEZI|nr:uncharacterized protein CORC01_14463 [Colletotrichum orchidophilum]OHE90242.1 hypothetical protein CORC01_14463 [Colletotrichum orchidophilum]